MRKASFWQEAAKSLPASVRKRYAGHFETAERYEEAFDALIEASSRAKQAIAGLFRAAPRAPRTHP